MRDPMNWSIPVFRAFGIQVKVHLLLIVFAIGMTLRQSSMLPHVSFLDIFLLTVVVLFVVILLHEFGHCFGARHVGGDAKEVMLWPLGGLAYVDVPHNPRAHFITVVAGPGVNVVICLVCVIGMAGAGYLPSLNPLRDPYLAQVYNFREERAEVSYYGTPQAALEYWKKNAPEFWKDEITAEKVAESYRSKGLERAQAPLGVVWAYRIFFVSWWLFLFNLIPAYPMDGGRVLQSVVWWRRDYRKGVVVAAYTGFVIAVLMLILAIWWNEALLIGLSLFILYESSMALYRLEMEDTGPFGYDFSAGYTSLEKDDEPPPRPKRAGWFKRWRQGRALKRLQRENEERARDEERMDQLLDKIARTGKESLTEEERRFLERMSARRRNMS
jgi:stage IV sporulation protein FB